MANLRLDIRDVVAGGEHEADVRPSEGVRRDVREDRRLSTLRSQLVGSFERALDDAAYVLAIAPTARARRKGRSVEIDRRPAAAIRLKLVPQARNDVDDPDAGARLGLSDVDPLSRKIDMAIVELVQLADA